MNIIRTIILICICLAIAYTGLSRETLPLIVHFAFLYLLYQIVTSVDMNVVTDYLTKTAVDVEDDKILVNKATINDVMNDSKNFDPSVKAWYILSGKAKISSEWITSDDGIYDALKKGGNVPAMRQPLVWTRYLTALELFLKTYYVDGIQRNKYGTLDVLITMSESLADIGQEMVVGLPSGSNVAQMISAIAMFTHEKCKVLALAVNKQHSIPPFTKVSALINTISAMEHGIVDPYDARRGVVSE
jgi:hypothetical protein